MPSFSIPKDTIEGKPTVPPGIYNLRFDGIRPALSKQKDGKDRSINFNPILKIVPSDGQPAEIADQQIYFNMNVGFRPGIVDLVHALGQSLVLNPTTGNYDVPGTVTGVDPRPETWVYSKGPLLGEIAKAEITEDPVLDEKGLPTGRFRNSIKQLFCRVPNCQERHSTNLAGN